MTDLCGSVAWADAGSPATNDAGARTIGGARTWRRALLTAPAAALASKDACSLSLSARSAALADTTTATGGALDPSLPAEASLLLPEAFRRPPVFKLKDWRMPPAPLVRDPEECLPFVDPSAFGAWWFVPLLFFPIVTKSQDLFFRRFW